MSKSEVLEMSSVLSEIFFFTLTFLNNRSWRQLHISRQKQHSCDNEVKVLFFLVVFLSYHKILYCQINSSHSLPPDQVYSWVPELSFPEESSQYLPLSDSAHETSYGGVMNWTVFPPSWTWHVDKNPLYLVEKLLGRHHILPQNWECIGEVGWVPTRHCLQFHEVFRENLQDSFPSMNDRYYWWKLLMPCLLSVRQWRIHA